MGATTRRTSGLARRRRNNRPSILGAFMSFLSLAFGLLHFVRLGSAGSARFLVVRVLAGALAPVWAVFGLLGALAGVRNRQPRVVLAGIAGLLSSAGYMRRIAAVTPPVLGRTARNGATDVERDVAFGLAAVPETCGGGERPLYCDLWQPVVGEERSGIGIVYLHGSGWYLGDKAQMTDPALRSWAANGHVVMDVAYRMCPETDLRGMLTDAWTAVAWLKTRAGQLALDPDKIVLSGTSAGGHIALLSAYTADQAGSIAPELAGRDMSVGGVFTMSAPIDMDAMLRHHPDMINSAHPRPGAAYDPLTDIDPVVPPGPGASRRERLQWNRAQIRRMSGLLRDLVGGGPDDSPELFAFATVGTHVRPGLPPTLLIQGDQDALVPVQPARDLHWRLRELGVKSEYLELPQTDHAFEIAAPQISPPARAATVATLNFLAQL